MADNEAAVLAAAKKLPLDERAAHKTWKVRSELFDDVKDACAKAFSSEDPILHQAGPLFAKGLGDANLNVQDTSIEALCAWLAKADVQQASRLASSVCSAIGAKSLKARPFTVAKAAEACYLLVELEQQESVVESAIKASGDKVPKVAVAALDILKNAVSLFGTKVVDPKPIIRALPTVYGSANAQVRDKAKEISVELASYLGLAVVAGALFEKMPAAMKKDVEAAIAELPPGKRAPERWTRREQEERAVAAGQPEAMDVDDEAEPGLVAVEAAEEVDEGVDAYEYATPVDILGPLQKEVLTIGDDRVAFWDCFESKKWNVRKAALDRLRDAARATRLAEGDYGAVVRELKKVLAKDANITCATAAAEVAGALGSGLRSGFSNAAKSLCPNLLERLKEKNIMMSRAAEDTLRTLGTHCYSLLDVAEDLVAAMEHKNPKVRLETGKLVTAMVEGCPKPIALRALKESLPAALGKLASDADAGVREAAQAGLAAFAVRGGSLAAIEKVLEKLDDGKRKKVEELVAAAAAGPRAGKAAAPPAAKAAAAASKPASKGSSPRPGAGKSLGGAAIKAAQPAPARRQPAAAGAPPSARSAPGGGRDEEASAGPRLGPEEALERFAELVGADTVALLQSAKWQERLEGMEKVAALVAERGPAARDPGVLIQCLAVLPSWGEKNFQVLNKVYEVIAALAAGPLSRRDAGIAVEGMAEKIAELKHRLPVIAGLDAVSEAVGPGFVCTTLQRLAGAAKNPKVPAEALAWVAAAVPAFGVAAFDVPALLAWAREALGSAAAPVRARGVDLLGACHAQLGPAMAAGALEGLKPAQVTQVEDAFRRNPREEVVPTRHVRRRGAGAGAGTAAGGAAPMDVDEGGSEPSPGAVSVDDLLPRTSIAGAITPTLLSMLASSNWKERNTGIEQVDDLVRGAGGRIAPDLGELLPALKSRLADTNRNLAAKALLTLSRIATAMGPEFDRVAGRLLLAPAVSNLSDNKKQVRDAALGLLTAWLGVASLDRLLPAVLEAVVATRTLADGKVAALAWMTESLGPGVKREGADALVRAILAASRDKTVAVRDAGSALLVAAAQVVPHDSLLAAQNGLPAGDKKAAGELFAKLAGGGLGEGPRGPAAPSAAGPAAMMTSAAAGRQAKPAAGAARLPGAFEPQPKAPEPVEAAILVPQPQAREERARRFRPRSLRYEGLSPDEPELLEKEFQGVASPEFRALLFSRDFKGHLQAADTLLAQLDLVWAGVVAGLDLILRWVVLRMADGNMQSLVRVLELARALLCALRDAGGHLTELDALVFLPAIVEKAGHGQDRVRALHREVLHAAAGLYPVPRLLDLVTPGLASKSARTRIECAEFLAERLDLDGAGPALASRSKPISAVAALLKDRDGATRTAALTVIEAVWVAEGDEVWRHLGRLDVREHDLVEEKLRRSTRARVAAPTAAAAQIPASTLAPPATQARPPSPGPAPSPPVPAAVAGTPEFSAPMPPRFTPPVPLQATPAPAGWEAGAGGQARPALPPAGAGAVAPRAAAPPPQDEPGFEARWTAQVAGVASPDMDEAVEAMKQVCSDLMPAAEGRMSARSVALMAASAETLFATVHAQLSSILGAGERPPPGGPGVQPSARGCKYGLNVLLQGLAIPDVALSLSQGVLRDTISLLLLRLLDDRSLLRFEEGPTLVKAVNVLMLKVLETTNRTYCFAALLQLLRAPPKGITAEQLPKFYDLVVKCLIKLTKSLQAEMEGVDLESLLLNIHDFFLFLGVDEIRRRSGVDDKPLRMVKTILHELCKMQGYGIYAHARGIPGRDAQPQPIIFAYIALNLQTLSNSGVIAPEKGDSASPAASEGSGGAGGAGPAPSAISEEDKAAVKAGLKDIMPRLMHRSEAEGAMQQLYHLRRQHPEYVDKYIAGTSDMFRAYIRDGLAKLEARDDGAQDPGTPPASAANGAPADGRPGGDDRPPLPVPPRRGAGVAALTRPSPGPAGLPPVLSIPSPGAAPGFGSGTPGGQGAAATPSPLASARSDGSAAGSVARLNSLRERLASARGSVEGGLPPAAALSPGRSLGRPSGDLTSVRSAIDELADRMAALRRASHTSG
ncbi:TOG1 [Auxenochlorella protothecoides x Auxenochlorella symbiontica]